MTDRSLIEMFLQGDCFAVVGASRDRSKYGNKVLRAYLQRKLSVYAVNPLAKEVEGLVVYPDLASLPLVPHGVSIITPPTITEAVLAEAAALGVRYVWLQPGAESTAVIRRGTELGLEMIHSGPCLLVVLGYHE